MLTRLASVAALSAEGESDSHVRCSKREKRQTSHSSKRNWDRKSRQIERLVRLRFERAHAIAVPEPGGVVLLGIGTIFFGLRCRREVRQRAQFIRVPEVRSGEAAKTVQLICLRQSP